MTKECHNKVIDELADMNYEGHIAYYINNEPLLDKRLSSFMAYLKSKNLNLRHVRIQTNGILLTKEMGEELFRNGLTWLIINDYSKNQEKSQKHIEIKNYLKNKFPDKKIDFRHRSSVEILSNRMGFAPNKKTQVLLKACCKYTFY